MSPPPAETVAKELVRLRNKMGLTDLRLALGGTIPQDDVVLLKEIGIDLVVSTKSNLTETIQNLIELAATPAAP